MTPRLQAWLGVALVGVLALGSLLSTAGHATTVTNRLLSSEQMRRAVYSNSYYSCLEAKGHALIRPTDRVYVYVALADLDSWVVLTKVLGGWAHLQERRAGATVAVLLVKLPRPEKGSTRHRQTLVTVRPGPAGGVTLAGGAASGSCAS